MQTALASKHNTGKVCSSILCSSFCVLCSSTTINSVLFFSSPSTAFAGSPAGKIHTTFGWLPCRGSALLPKWRTTIHTLMMDRQIFSFPITSDVTCTVHPQCSVLLADVEGASVLTVPFALSQPSLQSKQRSATISSSGDDDLCDSSTAAPLMCSAT